MKQLLLLLLQQDISWTITLHRLLIPTQKFYTKITIIGNLEILYGDISSGQLMLSNQSQTLEKRSNTAYWSNNNKQRKHRISVTCMQISQLLHKFLTNYFKDWISSDKQTHSSNLKRLACRIWGTFSELNLAENLPGKPDNRLLNLAKPTNA